MKPAAREINIKPSCANELMALPSDQNAQVWEKINRLLDDPLPDGKLKKKLKVSKDPLYRLRAGDYRIFYRFGDTWVRLLGIRLRNEDTYRQQPGEAKDVKPEAPTDAGDEDLDELLALGEQRNEFKFDAVAPAAELPRKITPEWLQELKVPAAYFPALVPCRTEDELLAAAVPQGVIERVIDNLFPKAIDEVENQPDLLVRNPSDLIRYREGELISFLLRLDEDQERLASWALKGPTMIKGGAGTGKSTVALYRIKAFLERPGASGSERVLFATYTRALMAASRQLLEQLLTPEQFSRVRVATCDEIAYEIATRGTAKPTVVFGRELTDLLRSVRQQRGNDSSGGFEAAMTRRKLASISDRYLLEEFEWIIDGRGMTAVDDYLAAPRPGRGIALREGARREVWKLYERFKKALSDNGSVQYCEIRQMALARVEAGDATSRYDLVVVDEAQDLAPVALALMAELAVTDQGICFAADMKQSLYSRNYRWVTAHPRLQFKGRTAVLKRNYRSTAEIDRAAYDILSAEQFEDLEPSASIHTGPLPVFLTNVPADQEGRWIARFLRQMSSHLRIKTNATAVLTLSRSEGERLAADLNNEGLPAHFFEGRELDLKAEAVKVLTLHAAKGLEFPVVVVTGFSGGGYPHRGDYGDADLYTEHLNGHRRLLYVGMTRAMRGLLVVCPEDCDDEALDGLASGNWYVEDVSKK